VRYALFALLAACADQSGTLSVTLTTAPGSHVLDAASELRLVLTSPHQVQTATRGGSGFTISIEVPATGATTSLIVDALDDTGAIIATGASPPFALGGSDAEVAIYMAAPNTIGAAPAALATARAALATGALAYGAIFAGGLDPTGAASDALEIYNAYDHTLIEGLTMPAARSAQMLGVGSNGLVYLFGGADSTGTPTDSLWSFDTTAAPSGSYSDLGDKTGFARANAATVPIASDEYLIAGMPGFDLIGTQGAVTAVAKVPALPAAGTSVEASDGTTTALFADATGVVRYRAGAYDTPTIAAATRAGSVIALPGGEFAVVCGGLSDGVEIDAATESTMALPGVPGVGKTGCVTAATATGVLIAGGLLESGGVDPTATIYDPATFAPIATTTLVVPRYNAVGLPLPNGQILIAGGVDANGAPIATLELFTPASAE